MRLLVLCTLAALSAEAQTADPNPPWSYDPVEVGNVRSYALEDGAQVAPSRTDSPASVTLDGHRWVVRRTQAFRRDTVLSTPGWTRAEERVLVRYDTAAANVVARDLDGAERMLYPCRLDLPVPPAGESASCGDGASYRVDLEADVEVGDRVVRTAVRSFSAEAGDVRLAAGVGAVDLGLEDGRRSRLVGAVVRSDTVAAEPEWFPASRPDPVAGSRYVPLAVGNEWQYESGRVGVAEDLLRHRVTGTRDLEGETYFVVETSYFRPRTGRDRWSVSPEKDLVRYDTLTARVVFAPGSGGRFWRRPLCPFDEPLNESPYDDGAVFCTADEYGPPESATRSDRGVQRQETGLTVESESFKQFVSISTAGDFLQYAADIGFLPDSGGRIFEPPYTGLAYARVLQPDGTVLEAGRRYAVAADDAPTDRAFALEVGPNPTAGPLTVALEVAAPSAVTVEVFDALGRRVHVLEVAVAGRAALALDGSRWAPGLYVVRARSGLEAATATVVRR